MPRYQEIVFTGQYEKIDKLVKEKKITKEELELLINNVETKEIEVTCKINDWKINDTGNKILDLLFLSEHQHSDEEKIKILLAVLESLSKKVDSQVKP